MSVQRRRSRLGVAVLVVGVGLALTPAPPVLGGALVAVAVGLVTGGGRPRG